MHVHFKRMPEIFSFLYSVYQLYFEKNFFYNIPRLHFIDLVTDKVKFPVITIITPGP